MEQLNELRGKLNSIDKELKLLINQRMDISTEVANVKKTNGLPLFDKKREKEILDRILEEEYDYKNEIKEVYDSILTISRKVQSKMLYPKRLFLIGYMGVGKTSVGKELSNLSGFSFIDMDDEIEKKEGAKTKDIFKKWGEHHFRNLEAELLDILCEKEGMVISCGGGIICDVPNCEKLIDDEGLVIFLRGDLEEQFNRVKNDENRPNAYLYDSSEEERKDNFERLYKIREESYLKVADIVVEASKKSIEEITIEIVNALGKIK